MKQATAGSMKIWSPMAKAIGLWQQLKPLHADNRLAVFAVPLLLTA